MCSRNLDETLNERFRAWFCQFYTLCRELRTLRIPLSQPEADCVLLSTFCFKGCHAGSQLLSLLYIGLPSICQTLYSFHLLHSFHFLSCDEASWNQLWGSMVEMHQRCSAGRSGWASYTLLHLNWYICCAPSSWNDTWRRTIYTLEPRTQANWVSPAVF